MRAINLDPVGEGCGCQHLNIIFNLELFWELKGKTLYKGSIWDFRIRAIFQHILNWICMCH